MKLAAARVNCGLSQQEVADELGVTRTTVGNWEHGRTAMSHLVKKHLQSSMRWILKTQSFQLSLGLKVDRQGGVTKNCHQQNVMTVFGKAQPL